MATIFESISLNGLRVSHLRQLKAYVEARDETFWYYGNREQFERRHAELMLWIDTAVRYAESEGVKMPNKPVQDGRATSCDNHKPVVMDGYEFCFACRQGKPHAT